MSEETEKITTIQNLDEDVCCDNNHAFAASRVKLIPFNSSSNTDLGNVVFVDCDFKIKSGTYTLVNSGFLMACPVCNLIHLSGFNKPTEHSVKVEGNDNTVPSRNLSTEL